MNRRQYKKKSITEFVTDKDKNLNPICCITSDYKYAATQEFMQVKYLSKVMNKANSQPEIRVVKDKYKIFGGKLHLYQSRTDTYEPVQRNSYIDITKYSERIKNDNSGKRNNETS